MYHLIKFFKTLNTAVFSEITSRVFFSYTQSTLILLASTNNAYYTSFSDKLLTLFLK